MVVECGGRVLLCVGECQREEAERAWGVVCGVVNLPSISFMPRLLSCVGFSFIPMQQLGRNLEEIYIQGGGAKGKGA